MGRVTCSILSGFFFKLSFFKNWSIVDLQYCVSFRCTAGFCFVFCRLYSLWVITRYRYLVQYSKSLLLICFIYSSLYLLMIPIFSIIILCRLNLCNCQLPMLGPSSLKAVGPWSWLGKVKEENGVRKEFEDPNWEQFLIPWKQNTIGTTRKLPMYFLLLTRHLHFFKGWKPPSHAYWCSSGNSFNQDSMQVIWRTCYESFCGGR